MTPPCCTLHSNERIRDLLRILFNCPPLFKDRLILSNLFEPFNIPFNFHSILNTYYEPVINLVIIFILKAGFVI